MTDIGHVTDPPSVTPRNKNPPSQWPEGFILPTIFSYPLTQYFFLFDRSCFHPSARKQVAMRLEWPA